MIYFLSGKCNAFSKYNLRTGALHCTLFSQSGVLHTHKLFSNAHDKYMWVVCHLAEAVEVQYLPLHMGEPDLGPLQLPEFSNLVQEVQPHPGESLDAHPQTHTHEIISLWLLIVLLPTADTYLQFIESLDSRCEAKIMNITGKRRLPILPEKNNTISLSPVLSQWCSRHMWSFLWSGCCKPDHKDGCFVV